jgi:PIN domain nuclease of toxin-antitoxin system
MGIALRPDHSVDTFCVRQFVVANTHVVVWLAFDASRLSRKAEAAIAKARKNGDGLAICDVTLLELTALVSKGRIHLDIRQM